MADASFRFRQTITVLTTRQLHVLGLILAARRDLNSEGMSLPSLADQFLSEPPNRLIAEICGGCPPGLISCLGKLSPRSIRPAYVYVDLRELLNEKRAANVLLHARRITTKMVRDLKALDPILRRQEFLGVLRRRGSVDAVNFLIASLLRFCTDINRNAVLESLARVTSPGGIERWYSCWMAKAAPPAPPWNGSNAIQPLTSTAAIRSAGREFRNCLGRMMNLVLLGHRYYYRYAHPATSEQAIIELIHDLRIGWKIGEIAGPKNRRPSNRISRIIVDEFSRAGIQRFPPFDELPDGFNPGFWD